MRSGSFGAGAAGVAKCGGGFAYLAVLALLAATALLAFQISGNWMAHLARDKEQELLFNGDQIARAIESYYNSGPLTGCYPPDLASLLEDLRGSHVRRHLRKMYREPIEGGDWVLLKDSFGGITGVRSDSEKLPFKQKDFPNAYRSFNGKTRYADWIFTAGHGTLSATSLAACRK
jgi:hypothetical protein